ncbi:glycosyltransferase [Providencia manganoxydans]|uniref:glycosyltransferase n=1 Tax=Providencia TaxID=586 RepID=UPI0034E516B1
MNPCISVYLPTHNRVELLKRAVSSVQNQDYKDWELIVVNDFSTDETSRFLDKIRKEDKRIIIINNDTPSGACLSRNKAISIAKGKYITGLDDDDYFLPNRLRSFLSDYDEKYAFIAYSHIIKNKDKNKIALKYSREFTLKDLLKKNYIGNQIFTETYKIKSVDGFDPNMPAWQDYDLWIRLMLEFGSCLKVNKANYIMDIGHEEERITTSLKPILAINQFIQKYESLSHDNLAHIKIYKKILNGEKVSIFNAIKVIDKDNFAWILKNVFK